MSLNKNILSEDLKRFRLLLEYDFYVPENYEEVDGDGLLMGEDDPADEDDSLGDAPVDDLATDGEGGEDDFGSEPEGEEGMDDLGGDESNEPLGDDPAAMGDEEPVDLSGGDDMAPPMEPQEDSVELDITQLVQGTEAAKQSADLANQQIAQLLQKFNNVDMKLSQMGQINKKIDGLEHEIEKRNPTEQEKLEMRSLSSYPYNLKLTDYWADKEGAYDVMGNNEERKPKEFVLTQDDVDSDYSAGNIKNSFNAPDYEEEDI